jgi:hypothetical protein
MCLLHWDATLSFQAANKLEVLSEPDQHVRGSGRQQNTTHNVFKMCEIKIMVFFYIILSTVNVLGDYK